ncbi:MAG: primosomal protein N' [Planctomycetes bacterium]|nr:primosomal protein N' [Planctomycetota bacterium]
MGTDSTTDGRGQIWLLPAEGQAGHHRVADVAVDLRTFRLYTYAIPAALGDAVRPGVTVRVPYGRSGRFVDGWCVRVSSQPWDHTRKPLAEVTGAESLVSTALIALGLWLAEYYAHPPGFTLSTMVPASLRKVPLQKIAYVQATGVAPDQRLTERQRALLDVIARGELPRNEALQQAGVSASTLRTLQRRGLLEVVVRREARPVPVPAVVPEDVPASAEDAYELTPGQQAALAVILAAAADPAEFCTFLLFGVPGSGKTEVYVRAMRAVIGGGKQAILLVPEIALATQVVERLMRRFARVAVLHSRLTAATRRRTLRAVAAGQVDLVIGTRTAVFAPCPNLGLIVVDEEQDSSLKNMSAPFYHARDVAIKRGQIEGVPVVLGSATPALETWYNAAYLKRYRLLRLPERVPGARLPEVRLIATNGRELGQSTSILSARLIANLKATLAAGQQAILLHNRRGYAVYLRCTTCGLTVRCTRCGGHMVYHRSDALMKCHRCGHQHEVPDHCLDETCRGQLQRTGLAIQRLEEELRRTFPSVRLLRLDSDTMRHREDYRVALQRFEAGEADIMLGTQMVAKGLDFPAVRLVGVIDADAALWLPDFRAAEQAFQLLVQVVGRAGRREGDSLALVQSADAESPAIRHGIRMDYESFTLSELAVRKQLFDPPFARLVRCICLDNRPGRARAEAARLTSALRVLAGRIDAGLRVDDSAPCVIPRLRDMFRYHVLVRAPRNGSAQRLLHEATRAKLLSPNVQRFTIDVDPMDML